MNLIQPQSALLVSEATVSALRNLQAVLSSRTPSQPSAPSQHSHQPPPQQKQQQQKQRELSEPPAVHLYLQRLAPVFVRPPPEPLTTPSHPQNITEEDGRQDTRRQLLVLRRREWQAAYVLRPSRPVGRPCPIRTAFAAGASTIVRLHAAKRLNRTRMREFVDVVTYLFRMSGDVYAGQELLRAMAACQDGPSLPPPITGVKRTAPIERGPGTTEWVTDMMSWPDAYVARFILNKSVNIKQGMDIMKCNENMERTFMTTDELVKGAKELQTCPPPVLARFMDQEGIRRLYSQLVEGQFSDGNEEGQYRTTVTLRDRSGREHTCVCVTRMHWMARSLVLVVAFVPIESWVDNANKRHTFPPSYSPPPSQQPHPHWEGEAILLDLRQSSDNSTSSQSTLPLEGSPPHLSLPPSMLDSHTLDGMGAGGCWGHATIGDVADRSPAFGDIGGRSPVAHPRAHTQVIQGVSGVATPRQFTRRGISVPAYTHPDPAVTAYTPTDPTVALSAPHSPKSVDAQGPLEGPRETERQLQAAVSSGPTLAADTPGVVTTLCGPLVEAQAENKVVMDTDELAMLNDALF